MDKLNKAERKRRIVAELRANPTVRISTLAAGFSVSSETVRRDIDELSASGLVTRTYGGAAATSMSHEPAVDQRFGAMVAERKRIARLAATMVEPGDVVLVDAGSTVTHFAHQLALEDIEATVITNSLGVATALGASESVRVILCPGHYIGREHAVYGPETGQFLKGFHANRAIIGASGLTLEGVTEAHSPAAWVKRAMLERAERCSLLVDRGKFDQPFLEVVCPFESLDDVVCDSLPPKALGRALMRAKVAVHVA